MDWDWDWDSDWDGMTDKEVTWWTKMLYLST